MRSTRSSKQSRSLLFVSLAAVTGACVAGESRTEPASAESTISAITACTAGARPTAGHGVVPALGDRSFASPVAMIASPTDAAVFYVVEKKGVIQRANADGTATVFADITERVRSGGEAGLLGFALHPKFAENGAVFFSYTKPSSTSPANLASVIARASSTDGGLTLDPATLVEILTFDQPFGNHNGGGIAFGPDGMLYAGYGDGGSGGDPQKNGQNKNTLLGKMLRLDVDGGTPFAIPPTNPFASGGGRPEIFAYGLRNPWRWSFDRATGDLWVGDVGQGKWEEIDRVILGGNYGWGTREGAHCFGAGPCEIPGAIDPVVEYGRSDGFSVTGGYVYRGTKIPSLVGHYLYGDYGSGKIWDISIKGDVPPAAHLLIESGMSIASFAEDLAGEIYVVDHSSGKIKKIVTTSEQDSIPQKLQATGCFEADPRVPSGRLVPYEVNSPLWSDGAEKARWMALPPNGTIRVLPDGDWDLPNGTVLVKEFHLGGKRVETRLFVRHTDGSWAGYTYEWNDAETDATLLLEAKAKPVAGGTWSYPSRAQCAFCHNGAARGAIGLETAQLNRTVTLPDGTTVNQLTRLEALGAFDPAAPLPAEPRAAMPAPADESQPVDARARAYLHANCAYCHQPGGPGRGIGDFRFGPTFADTKLCNGELQGNTYGIDGGRLLVPGKPTSSLISVRIHASDGARMPPIGTSVVDTLGASLVDSWIQETTACP